MLDVQYHPCLQEMDMAFIVKGTHFAELWKNMYNNKSICVVVPAFNEETQIGKVIDTMPAYIDRIVVVDDSSRDKTVETVKRYQNQSEKVVLIEHEANQGVGGAIISGYKWARKYEFDVTVVMAGDGQMDPGDLRRYCRSGCKRFSRLFKGKPAVLRGCLEYDATLPVSGELFSFFTY